MATKHRTARKKTAKVKKLKTYPKNLGVVARHGGSRIRHISIGVQYPQPICSSDGYGWSASETAKNHALPLCKRCVGTVEKLHKQLQADFGYVNKDTLLETKRAEFLELLADLDGDG